MMFRSSRATAAAILGAGMLLTSLDATRADDATPIVLTAEGEIAPKVSPFDEVNAGMSISVMPVGSLTLEHYQTCQTVSIFGGGIVINADGFNLADAKVSASEERDCPAIVDLVYTGLKTSASITRRQVPAVVGLTPTFRFLGQDGVPATIQISREGVVIARLDVTDRAFRLPPNQPLVDGARYVLRMTIEGKTATIVFYADQTTRNLGFLRP